MKRVLMTMPSLDRSFGGPVNKARMAPMLRDHGWDARVVGCGPANMPRTVGVRAVARFRGTPIPATLKPMRQLIRGADIVHIIGYRDPLGTVAAIQAQRRDIPIVFEPTGMYGRKFRSFAIKAAFDATIGALVAGRAAVVIATSRAEVEELIAAGIPAAAVRLRFNGIAVDDCDPLPARGALRARYQIPAESPLVLALGRLIAIKGFSTLVRAVAMEPGLHVIIAGPDEGDQTLEGIQRLRDELGIRDRVHIIPQGVWGADKAQAFADADVVCMPSQSESFGVAAAEAACLGIPVVVTDRCGVTDVLNDRLAVVVPYGDEVALAKGILEALTLRANPGLKSAADALRARLDWRGLAAEQAAIYDEVLGV